MKRLRILAALVTVSTLPACDTVTEWRPDGTIVQTKSVSPFAGKAIDGAVIIAAPRVASK